MTQINLDTISEEELLNTRIRDLSLQIEGTWLKDCVQKLYQELEVKGLIFKPVCYLADEWLTPEFHPVIGIPFYLAHPTLTKLEKKMMLEAEGETPEWCMKLLRHETGHALSYAYRLYKKTKWKKLFGSASEEYPDTYRFRPYSKSFVRHLDGFYAQYHPDEDFVETFAVWLTPQLDWQKQYRGWKAFEKLRYVDKLMTEIKGKPPLVKTGRKYWHFKTAKTTLKNFYKKKLRYSAEDFPQFHDANLKSIFKEKDENNHAFLGAADIIRTHKEMIINNIARWTGERKYIIHDLVTKIMKRCQDLQLGTYESAAVVLLRITAYTTTWVMNYVYTGWYRGDKSKKRIK